MLTKALLVCTLAGAFTALGGILAAVLPVGRQSTAFAMGFAGGVMVTVSLADLVPTAFDTYAQALPAARAAWQVCSLFCLGGLAALLLARALPEPPPRLTGKKKTPSAVTSAAQPFGGIQTAAARSALVTLAVVVLHNLPEGVLTLFTGYADLRLALPVALAIGLHNLPEGLVIAAPILAAGGSRARAVGAAALSGLAEPLGAVVAFRFLYGYINPAFLNGLLCLVSGMMCTVSTTELFTLGYRLQCAAPAVEPPARGCSCGIGAALGMAVMLAGILLLNE